MQARTGGDESGGRAEAEGGFTRRADEVVGSGVAGAEVVHVIVEPSRSGAAHWSYAIVLRCRVVQKTKR